MSGKVILNYDNLNLDGRYPDAIIQKFDPGASHARYYMADTVHMKRRPDMKWEDMYSLAKASAPLMEKLVIEDLPVHNWSHDGKEGVFTAANLPKTVYAM